MASDNPDRAGIGTLQETGLHADLVAWYARPGDRLEAQVAGYCVDIARGGLLIEVQTGSFGKLRPKLDRLLAEHAVRLVCPIPERRWIVRLAQEGGEVLGRRRSPRRGRVEDLFTELARLSDLLAHPRLTYEVLLVHDEELRCHDGRGSWRRHGWSIVDRRLLSVSASVPLEGADAMAALLPHRLPDPFTSADLAAALELRASLAGRMAYCLRRAGAIAQVGRHGRRYLYARRK